MCLSNDWLSWQRCTCYDTCPQHPTKQPSTWISTTTTLPTYVPKHRKPGPAQ